MDQIIFSEFIIYIKRFFLIIGIYFLIFSIGELNASHYLFFILNISYVIYSYILLYPFISVTIFYLEKRQIRNDSKIISIQLIIIYMAVIFIFLLLMDLINAIVHNSLVGISDLSLYISIFFLVIYIVAIKNKLQFAFQYLRNRSFYLQ